MDIEPGRRSMAMVAPIGRSIANIMRAEDRVANTIRRLQGLCRRATLAFSLAVGKIVVEEVYCGEIARWRSRNPNKDISFRKLSRHPDLPMSPVALWRCVAIHELNERLGPTDWRHVSSSHLRAVLGCPDVLQAQLLRQAETGRWSVRELTSHVESELAASGHQRSSRPGRRTATPLDRSLRTLDACVRKLVVAVDELESGDGMSGECARSTLEIVARTQALCCSLHERLAQRT
jgi:hypothetical protein